MNKQEQIEKWISGSLIGDDLTAFQQTEDYKNLVRMDAALQRFKPSGFNAEASFQTINVRKQKTTKVIRFDFPWATVMKAAAVLVFGFGLVFILNQKFFGSEIKTYATTAGQTQQLVLPDQSVVILNAKSSLSFDAGKWDSDRKLKLEGEAFFKVTKGKTFQVITASGTVTVLGTQFNVKQRADYYEVNCHEGKVAVKTAGENVRLIANQTYREINKVVSQPLLTLEAAPGWIDSESSFEDVPFREALNELERQYDVIVKIEDRKANQKYSGKFPNNDLNTALKSLTLPLGLTYRIEGKVIWLKNGE